MATGSAAAARARRDAAGYHQGVSKANGQARCDSCMHVRHPALVGTSKYDRLCDLHDASVKTHGCCGSHEVPVAPSRPRAEPIGGHGDSAVDKLYRYRCSR